MKLRSIGNDFNYELEKLCRLFLPFEKIEISEAVQPIEGELFGIVELKQGESTTLLSAEVSAFGRQYKHSTNVKNNIADYKRECETLLSVQLYKCLSELLGMECEWGVLTGIRPAKLFSNMISSLGKQGAIKHFKEKFLVSENKLSLCEETAKGERAIIEKSENNSYSLYVSIPFCPTRCSYCSFVSHAVDKAKKIIPDYLEKLLEELKITADIAKRNRLRLQTVYIGGGTPTTLSAQQLERLLSAINENFDLSGVLEFTVEAGRPDTITEEKLMAIKRGGATRISINPQTMNDAVLKGVGRNHTANQMRQAFYLARQIGFDNINTDLIAGLPNDDFESFKNSLEEIIQLSPESVTVHSLSLKRSSFLNKSGCLPQNDTGNIAAQMVNFARARLSGEGILPYYMYRQSKTVGNLENVGYARQGYEGYYNVYIMDETHTILACGASAVTKLKQPNGRQISRIFNYKYPYEYISQFDEIISRKAKIDEFYLSYSIENQ